MAGFGGIVARHEIADRPGLFSIRNNSGGIVQGKDTTARHPDGMVQGVFCIKLIYFL